MPALPPITRPIQEIALETAAKKLTAELKIFVAGPEIRKDISEEDLKAKPAAARLRLRVFKYITDIMLHNVIFGEHRGVREMGDDIYGSQSSFALTELGMIQGENCDAVIIFPSSAGSFCELGTWSQYEEICRKMLIVCDKRYEADESYLRLGAVKMATDVGAKVLWMDFEDDDNVISECENFVRAHHDLALRRRRTRAK